ncbi:hypothetical protein TELCIR_19590, partial [Teladorsagia circumcincta]
YLSASRKWVPEGIDACSSYLHLVAWGTAALMTIVVLVMQRAEIYHLSLMMSLAVGASCAMWVLSPKTLMSWHRVLCCGMCRAAPQKPATANAAGATRPLLEPPTAPPPHPPSHYVPMSSHGQNAWRPSKVV